MAVADDFATAKANLRDNVKTLVTIFGGVAGVLLVGSPFSGFGALSPLTDRWWVAAISLAMAAILIGAAIRVLMHSLAVELSYPSALHKGFKVDGLPAHIQSEVAALRAEFKLRRDELLPSGTPWLEDLEARADARWKVYEERRDEVARRSFDDVNDILERIQHWSAFVRFNYRVDTAVRRALGFGFVALVSLAAFAWAVAAKKEPETSMTALVFDADGASVRHAAAASPPTIGPIRFETGKTTLTPEAAEEIRKVQDALRRDPDLAVLVYPENHGAKMARAPAALWMQREQAINEAIRTLGAASVRIFSARAPAVDHESASNWPGKAQAPAEVRVVLFSLPREEAK